MLRNIPRPRFPRRRHTLLTHHGLFANGAAVIKAREFAETVGVNGVAAGQVLGGLATTKHVFAADGTVVLVLVLEALVGGKDRDGNAHAALVAVAKGFAAPDAAETAFFAVKGLFGL